MRKKKQEKVIDYKDFKEDLGFLFMIHNMKKDATKNFYLKVYASQKADIDPITDEELEKIIVKIVSDTMNSIGDNYKNFLIDKYFGNKENLISFISENTYTDLVSMAVDENNTKIKNRLNKEASISILKDMNKKG